MIVLFDVKTILLFLSLLQSQVLCSRQLLLELLELLQARLEDRPRVQQLLDVRDRIARGRRAHDRRARRGQAAPRAQMIVSKAWPACASIS